MEIKLSLDSGRFATKRAYYHPINQAMVKKSIPTLFTEIGYNELSGNSLRVEYKGSLYAVGGNLPYELIEENSKLVFSHELCIYTSMAQVIIESGLKLDEIHSFDLSINLPLNDFKNNKEAYEEKYQTDELIEMSVDNKRVKFVITRLRCYYEGMGTLIRHEKYRKGLVGVIDIGGKNETIIFYENFKAIRGMNMAGHEGSLVLFEAIARDLSAKYDTDFTIQQIEMMARGELDPINGFQESLDRHGLALAKLIRNKVISFKQNKVLARYVFTGGGSYVFKPYLQLVFSGYQIEFINDPQYDNAVGGLIRSHRERDKA